jgi:tetratricopeptide (TPR) repeat protein
MKKAILLILALLITAPAWSTETPDLKGAEAKAALAKYEAAIKAKPDDFEALKSAGIILHQMSRSDANKNQVEAADGYLKQAQKLKPDDAETLAWLGSVITMKALFETDPGKQTFFVKSGSRMLDKAIQQAPDNTVVRLIRAYNSLDLPPFLMRTKFAVEDFKYYLDLCAKRQCPPQYVADARAKLAVAEKAITDNK